LNKINKCSAKKFLPFLPEARLVKGKGKKGEGNVPLFPSPGRDGKGTNLKGKKGKEKFRGIPYIPLEKLEKNESFKL
jgi:hypothetical protein